MARILGAPVTDPEGKSPANRSAIGRSRGIRPVTVEVIKTKGKKAPEFPEEEGKEEETEG